MTREVTVITPENVTITYEMAGLGSRAAAQIVDLLLQFLVLLGLYAILFFLVMGPMRTAPGSAFAQFFADFAVAIGLIFTFILFVGYFIYFEGLKNGQTPGKRSLGLRVVKEEGAPIDLSAAMVRNLVRIVEISLGFYFLSIVSVLLSPMYKRLGDYAAGTIVVKERSPTIEIPKARPVPQRQHSPTRTEAVAAHNVDLLTREEIEAVRRFVERRSQLNPGVQEAVARQIAQPIMARLGMSETAGEFSYADFLEAMFDRNVQERGLL